MCKLTLAFSQRHLWSHLAPFFLPAPSNQFNPELQISWSILSHSLSKSPSSILHNFPCPLSLQIHCEIAHSGYQITVTAINFTTTPSALNLYIGKADLQQQLVLVFVYPLQKITKLLSFFFHTLCFSQHSEVNSHFDANSTSSCISHSVHMYTRTVNTFEFLPSSYG